MPDTAIELPQAWEPAMRMPMQQAPRPADEDLGLHLPRARPPLPGRADHGGARAARSQRDAVLACRRARQLAPLGIEGAAIDPAIERIEIEDYRERSQLGAIRSVFRAFLKRSASEAPDLEQAIAKHDPDVLLIDINCWGAATVAEASGRPWAMYSPYLLPLPSKDAPAYGPGLRPLGGPLGAVRDTIVNRVSERISFQSTMPRINALRSEHGLHALARFDDLLAAPNLLLSLTAEGFEYPRSDWPANVKLVGPMNWSPPFDGGPDACPHPAAP